jgi:hypothetical protein
MVHKSSIIPGLSKFVDTAILSHYPPTSLKRIAAAGGLAIYLQNSNLIEKIIQNPMFEGLGVATPDGMINIELLKDVYKNEINKAGFMRVHFPILGDIDFTAADLDTLYECIVAKTPTPVSNNLGTCM